MSEEIKATENTAGQMYVDIKKYAISEDALQKILNYLGNCPYAQVAPLIQSIVNLKEIK